jgi:GNAT superfamily N-acetyltransferase
VTVSQTHRPFQPEAIEASSRQIHAGDICALEAGAYEPARRLARDGMAHIARDPDGLSAVALAGGEVAGFAFAGPLEWFGDVAGVLQDPEWGRATALYSADVTVSPLFRRAGVGRRLKVWQMDNARSAGYRYIAGRNRMVLADAANGLLIRSRQPHKEPAQEQGGEPGHPQRTNLMHACRYICLTNRFDDDFDLIKERPSDASGLADSFDWERDVLIYLS